MSDIEKVSVALSPEMMQAIVQAVENGEYASSDAAIAEALQQWAERRVAFAKCSTNRSISVEEWKEFRDEGRP
jgi:Arc/MetJ-type ribon-helix-helix transcriptional regulator